MPRFSVIVPFFNEAEVIGQTIESICAQTLPDWEALFVDDGATDGSAEIVARAAQKDSRIRLLRNPSKGPSNARNFGASRALGALLSFCDADDLWLAGRLEELNHLFRSPGVSGAFGRVGFFRTRPGDGRAVSQVPERPLSIRDLLAENPVCTMSNLTVRRGAFLTTGGLDPEIVHNEDLEFLIRFTGAGHQLHPVSSLHVWYRTSPSGLSSDLNAMRAGRSSALHTARRFGYEPAPAQEAAYLRYLARRALRLDTGRLEALRFTASGLWCDASGFLFPLRRGGATALAALAVSVLPRRARRALFSH
ncbi:glycosyltransferase family 2 protein [uncultured Roseobacter sp.]|uniref:glycosyltransferase family 2 protein n=1 Tax=uncultured Roseobacter sp. TaxID=114847 RepID=UPI00262FBBF8|nr:glycosyltransferase family 2 protein [uncultured Roseobacter sp.]